MKWASVEIRLLRLRCVQGQVHNALALALIAPFGTLEALAMLVILSGVGGAYSYPVTGGSIDGTVVGGSLLAGYAFEGDNYEVNPLAGRLRARSHAVRLRQ